MSYDAAGNLTHDSYTGKGNRTYDAENRMTSAVSDIYGNSSFYTYDASGKRVRRSTPTEQVWHVYGLDGELLAEYAANAAPTQPQKEYGYRSGELLVTAESSGQINWLVADHLGTPRMVADLSGSLQGIRRHDYLPFGEEVGAGVGGRMQGQGYVADNVRQGFTGYEEDAETGLDYAQARYYSSIQGRFTSPDPYSIVGEVQAERDPEKAKRMLDTYLSEPQQWNRYAYVINNPLKYVDPTGEVVYLTGTAEEQQKALQRIKSMIGNERFNQLTVGSFCHKDFGEVTVLSYNSYSSHSSMEAIGNSDAEKEFSVRMASIFESKEIVEFKLATNATDKNGKSYDTDELSGGVTLGQGLSKTGNIQVFVHPAAGAAAGRNINTMIGRGEEFSNDGNSLYFTNEIVDSHEFGHAYGLIERTGHAIPRSLRFENLRRKHYKGIRQNERIKH